jgi:exopolysaccharide biosynthesis polyprenyl glycosylphosphotransferase
VNLEEADANLVVLDQNLGFTAQSIGRLSWELDKRGVELLASPSFLGSWSGRLNIERHPTLPLVQLSEPRLTPLGYVFKRLFDVIVTLPLAVLALPAAFLTAIAIKLTSRGPVLYVQPRVGVDGKLFTFLKFRSMYVGADLKRQEVLGRPDEDMPERYRNDPRITPVGRFIRRWSIDEVPQLWQVLKGDMSLVGPRPMLVEELDQLTEDQSRRRLVKPGVTGLWQISGRKDTTWEERMALDLQYIDKWSIGLDFVIVLRTVQVILTGKGSY